MTTTTTTYGIDDGDGNQITTGLPQESARATAQQAADRLGKPVWLYEESDGSESEQIDPR